MLELKMLGDNVLRQTANRIEKIDDTIKKELKEMVQLMQNENGVGLAAPQVGLTKRMLVMLDKKTSDDEGDLLLVINPKKKSVSDKLCEMEEGCLSVQGPNGPLYADVSRPESVIIEYTDEKGKTIEKTFTGLGARIVQHEMDHLDGILFIDYLTPIKRTMFANKVKKRENLKRRIK